MRLQEIQNRIAELMSLFVVQVKSATAMRRTDINHISETVLIPLFSEVYGYRNLENLNYTEEANYPGIDLGDKTARVAFQVTSTADSEKVKDTLRKFVKYKLHDEYDRLIIYILTEKQQSYSGRGYEEIIQNRFRFDKDSDIRDYSDLLQLIVGYQVDKAERVQEILEANFGQGITLQFGPTVEP